MKIKVSLDEKEVRDLIYRKIRETLGDAEIDIDRVSLMVKSKQNYKSEWEHAEIKVEYEKET